MIGLYRASSSLTAASSRSTARSSLAVVAKSTRALKATAEAAAKRNASSSSSSQNTTATAATTAATAAAVDSGIMSFPKRHPFVFQLFVATAKTTAADLMVQMVVDGKSFSEVDWRRNGIFVVFGFAYLGGFQYWIMVTKYGHWFPTMNKFASMSLAEKLKYPAGILDAGKMVLFDIFVHLPFMYFPTYYVVKEFVSGKSLNPIDWVKDGVGKYVGNAKEDLTAMVQLWGPSDCIQFILPLHIRMPFRHLVSFFWTAYVSFTRGSIKPQQQPAATNDAASTSSGAK